MSKPVLLVVAGCNGSGKSSFSRDLVPNHIIPFDYDATFAKFYASLLDSSFKFDMAHNMAFEELERQITTTIKTKGDFCYETNLNSSPLYWPSRFKDNGYALHLIFLCLDSIDEAKRRVDIRVENGGHFVPEDEIVKRFVDGYANLNKHFAFFDFVDLYDTSVYGRPPEFLFSIESSTVSLKTTFPKYLLGLLPNIATIM